MDRLLAVQQPSGVAQYNLGGGEAATRELQPWRSRRLDTLPEPLPQGVSRTWTASMPHAL